MNTTLETLDVRQNWLANEGCFGFGEVSFGRLKHLDMRDNFIGTEGFAALARGFKHNETLTSLNLHGNKPGTEGLWELGNALKTKKETFTKKESEKTHKYPENDGRPKARGRTKGDQRGEETGGGRSQAAHQRREGEEDRRS